VRDLAVLFLHLVATVARVAGPGGARSVVAESVLLKHQLLILNRSRKRSPNLRPADRVVAGLCALVMRPGGLIRSAFVFKPSTLLSLHRALIQRKYRRLFSSKGPTKPGPKGPSEEVVAAVVDMKQRNPTLGMSMDRATDHTGFRYSHQQGRGSSHSRWSVPADTRLGGAVLAHGPWSREGQSMES
jgi:putative transposase